MSLRNTHRIEKAMVADCMDAMPDCEKRATISSELSRTQSLLAQSLERAETMLSRLRGPEPEGVCKGEPHIPGLLEDATTNCRLANTLCNRLDELASLIG